MDNRIWSKKQKTVLIINKISIMLLKFLATIKSQLSQANKKPDNNTFIHGKLAIVILMRDFY